MAITFAYPKRLLDALRAEEPSDRDRNQFVFGAIHDEQRRELPSHRHSAPRNGKLARRRHDVGIRERKVRTGSINDLLVMHLEYATTGVVVLRRAGAESQNAFAVGIGLALTFLLGGSFGGYPGEHMSAISRMTTVH